MFDIKDIRNTKEYIDEGHKKRGLSLFSENVLKLDEKYRECITALQNFQKERNDIAKEFASVKNNPEKSLELSKRSEFIKTSIHNFEKESKEYKEQIDDILSHQPNTPLDNVPMGTCEKENVCVKINGDIPLFDFEPKPHFELGEQLEMIDFEQATVISGSRFVYLKKDLSRLERALNAFFLDVNTQEFGYTEVSPPFLVNDKAAYGTAQLPKFKDDLFQTTTGHWLISTGEIPLTNLVADKIVKESALPLRFTASTPCFRSEAGAAGRDTRGMIRLHQFNKVELVSITSQENVEEEFNHMLKAVETILQRLALPYRCVELCTGDLGFSARKTYDLEVWLPSQKTYREISSCSYCGDFQGRRMNARYKTKEGKNMFVHTYNGSSLPTGRTLVAILENYQQKDGSIKIPPVLIPYMNGQTIIQKG